MIPRDFLTSIAVVAMPWRFHATPSLAIGQLASKLRACAPGRVDVFNEFLEVWAALPASYDSLSFDERMAELVYAHHLHDEATRTSVHDTFVQWAAGARPQYYWFKPAAQPSGDVGDQFEQIQSIINQHLDTLVGRLVNEYSLVVLEAGTSQICASLCVIDRLSRLNAGCRTVLYAPRMGPELAGFLRSNYDTGTYFLAGTGASSDLLRLVDRGTGARTNGDSLTIPEVLPPDSTGDAGRRGEWHAPDCSDYQAQADRHSLLKWFIPIEGATDDGRRTADSIALEMENQSDRYENLRFAFSDVAEMCDEAEDFCRAIKGVARHFTFSRRVNARITPDGLLALWETGCRGAHLGCTGLTTRYLKRLGKGGTTIQTLHAMRYCYELGISNVAIFPTHHPAVTTEELSEILEFIRTYAIAYQPVEYRRFSLRLSESQETQQGNARTPTLSNLLAALQTPNANHIPSVEGNEQGDAPDWGAFEKSVHEWRRLHSELLRIDGEVWFLGARALYYYDGGSFLKISDRRRGHREFILDRLSGDIYLQCMRLSTRADLYERCRRMASPREVDEILAELLSLQVMFEDEGQLLSLAVAYSQELAVERIRKGESSAVGQL